MKVRLDFRDLSFLARNIMDAESNQIVVKDGREYSEADIQGLIARMVFDNAEDRWTIEGDDWKVDFLFDTVEEPTAEIPPDVVHYGSWGKYSDLTFTGNFQGYQKTMTLLKIVGNHNYPEVTSRVVEVEI